jgi:hypothetical protein
MSQTNKPQHINTYESFGIYFIAICYGLGGTGIKSQCWQDTVQLSRQALAQPPSHTISTGSFPGVKRLGQGINHPHTPSSAEDKEYSYTSMPLL